MFPVGAVRCWSFLIADFLLTGDRNVFDLLFRRGSAAVTGVCVVGSVRWAGFMGL